ncbi:MAG: P63C domain-containing protein [Nitrospirales bacterium]
MEDFSGNASEAGQTLSELGASKGGEARARALTKEQRSEIARKAANKRWESKDPQLPRETHQGMLAIGNREIPVSVLDDGTRVFSITGLSRAMGSKMKGGGRSAIDGSFQLPPFLASESIKQFINKDLLVPLLSPILYKPQHGGRPAVGYEATLLPQICEVILDAAKAGAFRKRSSPLVQTSEILLRGFARVGIIALIDEATGYQEVRDRRALQAILDLYLRKELAAWAQRFPNEFYQELFRLRGWDWRSKSSKRPRQAGKDTKNVIYSRLAPGILEELEKKNPPDENWHRKARHHQWLTEDIGHSALAQHLHAVMALMRISKDWPQFTEMLDKAFPKRGDSTQLLLEYGPTTSS